MQSAKERWQKTREQRRHMHVLMRRNKTTQEKALKKHHERNAQKTKMKKIKTIKPTRTFANTSLTGRISLKSITSTYRYIVTNSALQREREWTFSHCLFVLCFLSEPCDCNCPFIHYTHSTLYSFMCPFHKHTQAHTTNSFKPLVHTFNVYPVPNIHNLTCLITNRSLVSMLIPVCMNKWWSGHDPKTEMVFLYESRQEWVMPYKERERKILR